MIKGLYPESDTIKPKPIALAHVDVDLYWSTYNAFCHLKPLMAQGGRIYCDDAFCRGSHGATIAMCRFAHEQSMPILLDKIAHYKNNIPYAHAYFQF